MISIDIIAGARPNFVKIAPITRAIDMARASGIQIQYRLVHTGQHYDIALSGSFFEDLNIPKPDFNLEAGSGTQAEQTSKIMIAYERLLGNKPADLCLVVGDVTSTMAASIVAKKCGLQVAHVEAGIRSGDWSMPEEVNRVVTDSITNLFFTTSDIAGENLIKSGVDKANIHFVGNTMIDSLLNSMERFREPEIWSQHLLKQNDYIVLTMHRPANVDDLKVFARSLFTIAELAGNRRVVYPSHPRVMASLKEFNIPANILVVPPMPYLEFNYLVKNSLAVITDSGGITEETTVMGVPCMTLRDNTERPETISIGTNVLVGKDPAKLEPYLQILFKGKWKKSGIPEKWDGKAAHRIVEKLTEVLGT